MRFADQTALSVAALNRAVRFGLEQQWANVLVTGEISDLTIAASGHAYFTLNDEREAAQIRTIMFRSDVRRCRAQLTSGARVAIRGNLTLYEPRGTFQLLARAAYPQGEGDLSAQLKRLLAKLSAEGLTDPARKRPLPLLPRCIGLVTSEKGAALHDVLRVARQRCAVRIVLAPCQVQGSDAHLTIVRALLAVQKVPEVDVVVLARGGGSAEDLWAFNHESIARAIAACRVPVVTGIGHEIDTTIADAVADVRAATPSNAAELVVPVRAALEERLFGAVRQLSRALETRLGREQLMLSRATRRLTDPRARLGAARARLSELTQRLSRAITATVPPRRELLDQLTRRHMPLSPARRLATQRVRLVQAQGRLTSGRERWLGRAQHAHGELSQRLSAAGQASLTAHKESLLAASIRLDALSPLRVLARGYAIALHEPTGKALRRAAQAQAGDRLRIKLHDGELRAEVVGD